MEISPGPWLDALRRSHERLRAVAGPLDADQLRRQSYAADWSIAQVLSHIGSQAEIFGLFLDAGLSGQDPPGPEVFGPIWETWNVKGAQDQAADALRADETVTERFESIDDEQRKRFALKLFGMDFDATGLARMRLGEHAVHTWDIAVDLLIDTLGQLVARAGKPGGAQRRLHVSTSSPVRHFTLETGATVTLTASGYSEGLPELALPAEAFIRLVYGRLDPAHTPPVETRRADLDELRQVFPGF